jgi:hypothetical protein
MYSTASIGTQTQEFTISKKWRILLCILFTVSLIPAIGMGLVPFLDESPTNSGMYVLVIMSVCLSAFLIYALIATIKEKLIIGKGKFCYVMPIGQRELPFIYVKGYSKIKDNIIIHPTSKNFKKIKLSTYLGRATELEQFIAQNFTDLDSQALKEDQENILQNSLYGVTEEERISTLDKTKTLCKYINGIGFAISAWMLFCPTPYLLALAVGILYPLIVLTIARLNTLIRIDEIKNSAHPSIISGFITPTFALMLRALLDFHIFRISNLWPPVIAGFVCLLLFMITAEHIFSAAKKNVLSGISLLFFLFLFTAAACTLANCVLDNSPVQVYETKVLNKSITRGKSTIYYLKLDKWGPQTTVGDESVSESFYNRIQPGNTLSVYYRKGFFKAPWYIISN